MPLLSLTLALALAAESAPAALPDVTLDDLRRFPDRTACVQALALIRSYREAAWGRRALYPVEREFWDEHLADLERRYRAWDALDWARMYEGMGLDGEGDGDDYGDQALAWLGSLRGLIGVEDYRDGVMPLPTRGWE